MHDLAIRIGPDVRMPGTVRVTVPCRTSDVGEAGTHDVLVHPDWSIETGHDLVAERVAGAFGASTSCIAIADRGPTALRAAVQLRARRTLVDARRLHGLDAWRLPHHPRDRFSSAQHAAAHARDPRCLAHLADIDPAAFAALVAGVEARLPPVRTLFAEAAAVVAKQGDVEALWRAGVHPGFSLAAHRTLWPAGGPRLPAAFYVALAYDRPSLGYLRNVVAQTDDAGALVWAAATERAEDRRDPTARGALLATGADPRLLEDLFHHRYSAAEIRLLATSRGLSVPAAVTELHAWVAAGCLPSVGALVRADVIRGRPSVAPSAEQVATLVHRAGAGRWRSARYTDLGLILGLAGDFEVASRVVTSGWTQFDDVAAEVEHPHVDGSAT